MRRGWLPQPVGHDPDSFEVSDSQSLWVVTPKAGRETTNKSEQDAPVLGGRRQGVGGAVEGDRLAAFGAADERLGAEADGGVAHRQRHLSAGAVATLVAGRALVAAAVAPVRHAAQRQTLIGHDDAAAGVVHQFHALDNGQQQHQRPIPKAGGS